MMELFVIGLAVLTTVCAVGWRRAALRARCRTQVMDSALARLGNPTPSGRSERDLLAAADRTVTALGDQTARADQFADALEHAAFGVLLVDAKGTIVFANRGAQRYLNARHGDAVAEVQIEELIKDVATLATETRRELELYTPTRRVLGLHAVPLRSEDQAAGVAMFLEDLTAHRRVDAVRKEFVANASHELKTPLGALGLLAETLAGTEDPDTRHRLTDRLTVETRRMSRLIDDILDLAMVESTAGERTPVCLADVIAEAVAHVDIISEQHGVPLKVEPPDETVQIAGDHRQLVSAISNLLDNAIKYTYSSTPDAPAPVEMRTRTQDRHVVIEVEDHGIGIAEQHLPRIFERFYRVDRARSRQTGGTGLGLAIVRHVVLNHNGTIDVESQPGSGTTFRITLDLWSS